MRAGPREVPVNGREPGGSRRRLLRAAGTLAALSLAGCSGLVPGGPAQVDDDEPETHELTVRLEEPNGEPAVEASVSVVTAEGFIQRAEATVPDREGVVSFDLEDGEYLVEVESQEYTNVEEPVTVEGEDVEVTVTLRRGYG
jgi:hypothetical protein